MKDKPTQRWTRQPRYDRQHHQRGATGNCQTADRIDFPAEQNLAPFQGPRKAEGMACRRAFGTTKLDMVWNQDCAVHERPRSRAVVMPFGRMPVSLIWEGDDGIEYL